jgi:hypothetical protein
VPQIGVILPDQLLKVATAKAEELGKSLDELYAEALERYVRVTKHASAGSVRSRIMIPRSSPEIVVEVPEELFEQAEEAAKRQEKRVPIMYVDALAYHLAKAGVPAQSALDQGHDLPSGAWRPKGSS